MEATKWLTFLDVNGGVNIVKENLVDALSSYVCNEPTCKIRHYVVIVNATALPVKYEVIIAVAKELGIDNSVIPKAELTTVGMVS